MSDTITVGDFKPHMLVQYKGGLYEGCFWEWNYAYLTPKGEFVNLGCSGLNGCETLKKLEDYYLHKAAGDFCLYDLNDKESLVEVSDDFPVDHLIGVANKLKEAGHPVDFQPKCDECELRFSIELATPGALAGAGGVHTSHQEIICQECQERYTCCDCGEYVGSDGMAKGSRSCEDCYDEGDD